MYSLNIPVSELRTKVRQEFERHRYVNQLPVVDMLIFRSDSEFQVRIPPATPSQPVLIRLPPQETLNYWKQLPHVLKYFREKENPTARLPENFMQGFLEVYLLHFFSGCSTDG